MEDNGDWRAGLRGEVRQVLNVRNIFLIYITAPGFITILLKFNKRTYLLIIIDS